jgi:hypothetical protein
VERHIQTIEDRTTALLVQSGLKRRYWGEAILCTVATWNATTAKVKSPLESVTGRAGNLAMLKPFSCRVYIRTDGSMQRHMEPRAEMGIFLGHLGKTKGYRVSRDPEWKSVIIRAPRDCIFREDEYPAIEMKNRSLSRSDQSEEMSVAQEPVPISTNLRLQPMGRCNGSEQSERSERSERPGTPPIILPERYYSSNFEQEVMNTLQYGTRLGRNYHANINEEVNMILEDDLRAFHLENVQCTG